MGLNIEHYLKLLRIHQYVKNLFIFLPLFFTLKITDPILFIKAVAAFVAFSLIASTIYIFNDIRDLDEDKNHPVKKHRPLTANKIPLNYAVILMLVLFFTGNSIAYFLNINLLFILLLYFILNVLYSLGLKHISIIDIFIISIGFVLRIFAGSVTTNTSLTIWIIVMTFLLALFLALAKRRDDVFLMNKGNNITRKSIDGYNLVFIDSAMTIMASIIIVSYIFYTISSEIIEKFNSHYLYLTTLFVILGIMRYMQISFVEKKSGSPTLVLLRDKFLQFTVLGWIITFVILIY
ncbi:MAG: decaprenyl-phosphate phosphoribosyltransferase [bacterium]